MFTQAEGGKFAVRMIFREIPGDSGTPWEVRRFYIL
jgi:hypothetical protein